MLMTQEIEMDEIKVERPSRIPKPSVKKLTSIPFIFLIFFKFQEVLMEKNLQFKQQDHFSLLGFLIFLLIWSMPEALITAELATTYPVNGYLIPLKAITGALEFDHDNVDIGIGLFEAQLSSSSFQTEGMENLRLRLKNPHLVLPYKVPMFVPFLYVMCLIPAGFVVYVIVIMVMGNHVVLLLLQFVIIFY
ncbi:hypothetical protein MKX01_036520 [Papaver californicum]|nr:hypothetical protein MKX01_036520 [Papaver californicum]